MPAGILKKDEFVKTIIMRQMEKEADTFMIIYGARRTGKSTLGFHLIRRYFYWKKKIHNALMLKKEQGEELKPSWENYLKKYDWVPPNSWKQILLQHFATTTEEMVKKIKDLPSGSFVFIDEGIDVASWQHMMENEQKDLIELILKAGKKGLFTVFVTPSLSLLRKNILSEAHYFVIVPKEPAKGRNKGLVMRNYDNVILREQKPFGLHDLVKTVERWKNLPPHKFEMMIKRQHRFIGSFVWGKIPQNIYDLYDKLVKDPMLLRSRRKRRMVSKAKYDKLLYAMQTLLYNLYTRADFSYAQIENLLIDKWGNKLWGRTRIRAAIDTISMITEPVNPEDVDRELTEGMLMETALKKIAEAVQDVSVFEESTEKDINSENLNISSLSGAGEGHASETDNHEAVGENVSASDGNGQSEGSEENSEDHADQEKI